MSRFPDIPYYRITRLIQQGGMSAVYEGVDLRSKDTVAIKALFRDKAKDPFMLRRFKEEANHYLLLDHPDIPRLVDFVVADGRMYLIMEFVRGMDLNKYLHTYGPLDENMTVHFFTHILETIGYLHSHGILHLDIKPSNIMVTEDLGIKVLDLGIASAISEKETRKKKCGSPSFMAPEQIRGQNPEIGTDIYQTGVTLYNMITGKLPYEGNTREEIFDNICTLPVPRIAGNDIKVRQSIQPVIDRAMDKEIGERFSSCQEMETALLEVLQPTDNDADNPFTDQHKEDIETEQTESAMKIISVGRELGNDIVISNDSFVGRHHLQLIKDDAGAFFVRDLNSTNGTFVNGARITGEIRIESHDIIRIGNTALPWTNYFADSDATEIDDSDTPREKQTPEERAKRKAKMKKTMASVGKWIGRTLLAIITSVIMMLIIRMFMNGFSK